MLLITLQMNSEETMEVGFQTAAEQAYNVISQNILDGVYPPGMKLSKRKMAEATGVSVIPVIEALNRLEEDGLVESKPQWGSFVTIPTEQKMEDMLIFREAIECQIARVVAEKITDDDAKILRELAEVIDLESNDERTYSLISESHFKFHMKLAEITGFNSLQNALKRLNFFWILCKGVTSSREKKHHAPDWHMQLLNELLSGDPDRAEKMMRMHVLDSAIPILETVVKSVE